MADLALTYVLHLLLLVVNASNAVNATASSRWRLIRSSIYRKALVKVLVHECNANRCLMCQIKDSAAPFARFEETFSCLDTPPDVSIQEYLSAMYYNLHFGPDQPIDDAIFVIVMIYMGRLMDRTNVKVTYWNVHRLLSMSTWIAIKLQYDVVFKMNAAAGQCFGLDFEGIHSIYFLIG